MSKPPKVKTFIEYREYDMYESYLSVQEVPTRDLQKLDLKKLGSPDDFRFFDATVDADNNMISAPVNYSKNYRIAETVMMLGTYKKREEKKLEEYKKDKCGRLETFFSSVLANGLVNAFKRAIGSKRPVMEWYIHAVEHMIAGAEKNKATHIYLSHPEPQCVAKTVTADMVILDKELRQIHPSRTSSPVPKTTP